MIIENLPLIASLLGGYLIGSIPFGLILCAAFGYGDIRNIGSGNIGATNVLRTGNKLLAFITLILDIGKGVFAFVIAHVILAQLTIEADHAFLASIAAFSAVLGHIFPVWLKFKGGKGVATSVGALLAALPISGGAAILIWFISVAVTKISSLAALSAFLITPAVTYLFYGQTMAIIHVAVSALIWLRHIDNIKRIANGTEPKVKGKSASKPAQKDSDETGGA
jgi:glycerol-3-phosphate acyltransferase PlsY